MKFKYIAIDLDKTLTKTVCWTPQQCREAKPTKILDLVKKLQRKNVVVIYTARQNELMGATFEWLQVHGIGRCPVSNFKIGCDMYLLDDKAINVKDYKVLNKFI